ncbi:MAG: macro domain-containing protein [Alphaproteobacteria bacterium]|nr:macro domain-containing protein [Alphaproteobacteria bacterium]MBF0391803.1 macro domain-containing protein [Alphaproteobacteria bacterium]
MIIYHRTSILTSQAQTVVNTVNTVGVMGKGLASEFKARHPKMFEKYREYCASGLLEVGKLWLWKGDGQWVLNFPTKKHWRHPSKISYIELGLQKFVGQYEARGITEIAFPRLGCGNGGLEWSPVKNLMEQYLSCLPIKIYIHDFEKNIGLPEHKEEHTAQRLLLVGGQLPNRSFGGFERNIVDLIQRNNGEFRTVKRGTAFSVSLEEDGGLKIIHKHRTRNVLRDDMYTVWDMLLKGPVTKDQVSGTVWESAYLVFSMLSRLPFIRPIAVASKDGDETLAIELMQGVAPEAVPQRDSSD